MRFDSRAKKVLILLKNIKRQETLLIENLTPLIKTLNKSHFTDLLADANRLQLAINMLHEQLTTAEQELKKSHIDVEKIHEICHDLRNAISNVNGYTELILEKILDDKKTIKFQKRLLLMSKEIREALTIVLKISALASSQERLTSGEQRQKSPILPVMLRRKREGCVLVVDDDTLSLDLMNKWLSKKYLDVITAKNGREALKLIEKHPEIDIILLDVMMKGMTGYEVLKTIKSKPKLAKLPVIMLSGLDKLEMIVKCIQVGAEDYLIKPFNEFLMTARISACLEKKRLEFAEHEAKEQLNIITNALPVLISSVDPNLNFLFNNLAYEEWFQKPLLQITGKKIDEIFKGETLQLLKQSYAKAFAGNIINLELVINDRKNIKRYLTATLIPHYRENNIREVFSVMSDITQNKQNEEQLKFIATHDTLTSLPNRNLFDICISHAISQAEKYKKKIAVLFMDIDNFKLVNDHAGHDYGDLLLLKFTEDLRNSLRKTDILARLGGDEFVIIIDDFISQKDLVPFLNKIYKKLSKTYVINDYAFHVTISIGVSSFPKDGFDRQTLLKNADIAMYNAKESGKGGYRFFSKHMLKTPSNRFLLNTTLRNAIEKNEFVVYYQPIIERKSRKIVALEALLRWKHPIDGLLMPATFLHIAEETGLIMPISEWLLFTSCQFMQSLYLAGFKNLKLNVNISPRQFQEIDFYLTVLKVLDETGLDHKNLALEITESLAMQNIDHSITIMHRLKKAGINIIIDDFGTGFSCLSNLARLPVDGLKIDKVFIENIDKQLNQSIIDAVISLARNLGLSIVAEGIENKMQVNILRKMGCDYFQGYIFCKPLNSTDIKKFLQQYNKLSQLKPSTIATMR